MANTDKNLYKAINGLYSTDVALWNKLKLISGDLNDKYDSIPTGVIFWNDKDHNNLPTIISNDPTNWLDYNEQNGLLEVKVPLATQNAHGVVKGGSGIDIDPSGTVNVNVDGTTIVIDENNALKAVEQVTSDKFIIGKTVDNTEEFIEYTLSVNNVAVSEKIKVEKSDNSEDFFFVNNSGIGVSGISDAISGAITAAAYTAGNGIDSVKFDEKIIAVSGNAAQAIEVTEAGVGVVVNAAGAVLTDVNGLKVNVDDSTIKIIGNKLVATEFASGTFLNDIAGNGLYTQDQQLHVGQGIGITVGDNVIDVNLNPNGAILDDSGLRVNVDGTTIVIDENNVLKAVEQVDPVIADKFEIKSTSGDGFTEYQLFVQGVAVTEKIKVDFEKFMVRGEYIPSSEILKFTFNNEETAEVPVSALVDEYSEGNGIDITDSVNGKNIVSVVPNSGKAIEVTGSGVGVVANGNKAIEATEAGVGVVANVNKAIEATEAGVGVKVDTAGAVLTDVNGLKVNVDDSTIEIKDNKLVANIEYLNGFDAELAGLVENINTLTTEITGGTTSAS